MKSKSETTIGSEGQYIFQENLEVFLEKLAKAKIDFDSLTENMSQGLARCEIICDENNTPRDYKILSANKAFEAHTGLSREFCVGKRIKEILPGVEKSWIETYGRVALTQQTEIITGYNHNTKRHYRSVAYSDKKGEFMMLFEDTTHQIELEKAYELASKSMKISNDLLSNMPDGFKRGQIICDEHDRPVDFKILEVNEAYQEQTGIDIENYVGRTILEIFPDVEKSWIETIGQVALKGTPKHVINYNHNTEKYFEVSAFCPKIGEFAMFIRDVTEREKSRIALENAYKKVEESEKLKSAFLANMSHEIRTPLNAILGFAELLEEDGLKKVDQEKCLYNIKSSGNRLLTIVSDILDLSKLEANQQQLHYTTYNLNEIIEGLKEQFSIINTNTELEISTHKALQDDDALIETDAIRLEQILSNLIGNALKHTEKGWIRFGYTIKENFLEFFVEDTGSGIEKKNQKTIFERFGQISNKNEINKGVGLGIPIASGFAELFGGKMWVDSEPNKGSTFYFTIPYMPTKNKAKCPAKPTVLVAEDEEANFMLLEMWLKKYCNLIHAQDGQEAIALFREHDSVDLILMDIKMPYLNGIDASKQIREIDSEIPIIAQTAFVMDDEKRDILSAGCNEILSKPIRREQFKELLTKYIPSLKFD